ncbi:hypothetical protein DSECCO2_391100 [anaerobic digester metagenome]
MNSRFYLIIALLIILYGAWAYLAHSHGSSTGDRYEALAKLPVYAYVADTTKVASIVAGLENISGIATYTHETGYQAARELIKAYGLPLTEDTIAEYSFPDLITVNFLPARSIISAKASTLDLLRTHLEESDLDSQSTAFGEILQELSLLQRRSVVFTIYAGIMMLIIFIFSRLSYELHIYLKSKRRLVSVVDVMRHNKLNASHTWMMLILPVALVVAIYFAGAYLKYWPNLIPWWVFASMALSSLIATFVIAMMLRVYEHDRILAQAPPIINKADGAQDV